MTGDFPTQRASNAENVSIWWRHMKAVHGTILYRPVHVPCSPDPNKSDCFCKHILTQILHYLETCEEFNQRGALSAPPNMSKIRYIKLLEVRFSDVFIFLSIDLPHPHLINVIFKLNLKQGFGGLISKIMDKILYKVLNSAEFLLIKATYPVCYS